MYYLNVLSDVQLQVLILWVLANAHPTHTMGERKQTFGGLKGKNKH